MNASVGSMNRLLARFIFPKRLSIGFKLERRRRFGVRERFDFYYILLLNVKQIPNETHQKLIQQNRASLAA